MSDITKDEVKKVANLARLSLTENEIQSLQDDMSSILDFISQINEVETSNIEPTAHVLDIKNVFREDKTEKSLDREKIMELAPEKSNGFIVVPKVIG